MKERYSLVRRGSRGGRFYCFDSQTMTRWSLKTTDKDAARQLVLAKNQSERQPMLNLHIAKAYLAGTDHDMTTRTWQQTLDFLISTKHDANQDRWLRAAKDRAFVTLLPRVILETTAEHLMRVLRDGTVSTNVHLRRLHNFCLDMNWLPWPIIPKRLWPELRHKPKRAVTVGEHARIVAREQNPERKAFYQLAWHLGPSQSDLAHLEATDVDWTHRVITFFRMKTHSPVQIRFGDEVAAILRTLPAKGPFFPYLRGVKPGARANEFRERCRGLGIKGISLHSYRYSWAERAKAAGYPERYAQLALGHNSKAVHRAYARNVQVTLPALEDFEKKMTAQIIPLPVAAAG